MIAVVYSFLAERADKNDERLWQAGKEPEYRAQLDEQFTFGLDTEEPVDESNVIALAEWVRLANAGT